MENSQQSEQVPDINQQSITLSNLKIEHDEHEIDQRAFGYEEDEYGDVLILQPEEMSQFLEEHAHTDATPTQPDPGPSTSGTPREPISFEAFVITAGLSKEFLRSEWKIKDTDAVWEALCISSLNQAVLISKFFCGQSIEYATTPEIIEAITWELMGEGVWRFISGWMLIQYCCGKSMENLIELKERLFNKANGNYFDALINQMLLLSIASDRDSNPFLNQTINYLDAQLLSNVPLPVRKEIFCNHEETTQREQWIEKLIDRSLEILLSPIPVESNKAFYFASCNKFLQTVFLRTEIYVTPFYCILETNRLNVSEGVVKISTKLYKDAAEEIICIHQKVLDVNGIPAFTGNAKKWDLKYHPNYDVTSRTLLRVLYSFFNPNCCIPITCNVLRVLKAIKAQATIQSIMASNGYWKFENEETRQQADLVLQEDEVDLEAQQVCVELSNPQKKDAEKANLISPVSEKCLLKIVKSRQLKLTKAEIMKLVAIWIAHKEGIAVPENDITMARSTPQIAEKYQHIFGNVELDGSKELTTTAALLAKNVFILPQLLTKIVLIPMSE